MSFLSQLDDMPHLVCWRTDFGCDEWHIDWKDKQGRPYNYNRAWGRAQKLMLELGSELEVMVVTRRWESWL